MFMQYNLLKANMHFHIGGALLFAGSKFKYQ